MCCLIISAIGCEKSTTSTLQSTDPYKNTPNLSRSIAENPIQNAGTDHNAILDIAYNNIVQNRLLQGANETNFRSILQSAILDATHIYMQGNGYSDNEFTSDSLASMQLFEKYSNNLISYTRDTPTSKLYDQQLSTNIDQALLGLDSIAILAYTPSAFNQAVDNYCNIAVSGMTSGEANRFYPVQIVYKSSYDYWFNNMTKWNSMLADQVGPGVQFRGSPSQEAAGADGRWAIRLGGGVFVGAPWVAFCSAAVYVGDKNGWW